MTFLSHKKNYRASTIYAVLITALVVMVSIMASVPPVSRDALTHHLYIPKLYLLQGCIFEIPHIEFSYYPMNLDLLYLVSLYFKNDILPKFIHFSFAIATALMIFFYLKRRISFEYALLGALFFLSIPVIVCQSTIVYVDLGLVCFLFAAMMFLFKWIEAGFQFKPLIISAVFCGLALGTKYNGLIGLFLIGLFVPLVYARYHANHASHEIKAAGFLVLYILIALMVFLPWMARNVLWTGNPVYPLYKIVFNPDDQNFEIPGDEDSGILPRLTHLQIRRDIYGESGLEIALIPIRVFFQGKDNDPKYFDGRANPFLLLLPIFAFFGIRSNSQQVKTEKFLMLGFSTAFLLFACAQTVIRIRYFAPIFPPLVLLSMFGLYRIENYLSRQKIKVSDITKNLVIYSIIVTMLALNAKYMLERFSYLQPLTYLNGLVNRDEYIQKYRPEYASIQYANRNLTHSDRILGVYLGNRGYYSDIEMVFSIRLLQGLAEKSESAADIAAGLEKRSITHLMVNYELFNDWVKKYSIHEKRILNDFFQTHTVTKFSKDGYGLLEVN